MCKGGLSELELSSRDVKYASRPSGEKVTVKPRPVEMRPGANSRTGLLACVCATTLRQVSPALIMVFVINLIVATGSKTLPSAFREQQSLSGRFHTQRLITKNHVSTINDHEKVICTSDCWRASQAFVIWHPTAMPIVRFAGLVPVANMSRNATTIPKARTGSSAAKWARSGVGISRLLRRYRIARCVALCRTVRNRARRRWSCK